MRTEADDKLEALIQILATLAAIVVFTLAIAAVVMTIATHAIAENAPDPGSINPAPPVPPFTVLSEQYATCATGLGSDIEGYNSCVRALNYVRKTFFGLDGYSEAQSFNPRFRIPMTSVAQGMALIAACGQTRAQYQALKVACDDNLAAHAYFIAGR